MALFAGFVLTFDHLVVSVVDVAGSVFSSALGVALVGFFIFVWRKNDNEGHMQFNLFARRCLH